MSTRAQTVRLTPSQYRALASFAKQRGLSEYAMLARVVDAGLLTVARGESAEIETREMLAEMASIRMALVDAERTLDRILFTACAGYVYARSAATGARKSDELITAEINAAFDRQRRLAEEVKP